MATILDGSQPQGAFQAGKETRAARGRRNIADTAA